MSSEYGWDDEIIWDLPLGRFRQITAAIQSRKYFAARQESSRFSWLARNLAGFIAGGYMLKEGSENPAAEVARTLAYDDVEAALLGAEKPAVPANGNQSTGPDGVRVRAADIDPEEAIARAAAKNSNGSFGRFMGMTHALDQRGKML